MKVDIYKINCKQWNVLVLVWTSSWTWIWGI